jgi:hypothetical protein
MSDKHLHIISFNIPYPPNYGGIIDVFYKLKALHAKGIKIHLHCFEYDRENATELKNYCESVNYYKRRTGIISALSSRPYIVSSRRSEELIRNLLMDDHPILFEGLHSCFYLDDPRLHGRKLIYRESNIEHDYYYNLFKAEKQFFRKLYFLKASIKLRLYEKVLQHATMMLVVSTKDQEYLKNRFHSGHVHFLPSFHGNDEIACKTGRGGYALYHGNLSVAENYHAATFLIKDVFDDINMDLVIAGLNPPAHLKKAARNNTHVRIIENPADEELFGLIRDAHVNILVTFQATGLKLKLLNTLYNGRFVLVNEAMLNGTGLDELCIIGDDSLHLKKHLNDLAKTTFGQDQVDLRSAVLKGNYSNEANADRLIHYIF